jgi:hypothetical protein
MYSLDFNCPRCSDSVRFTLDVRFSYMSFRLGNGSAASTLSLIQSILTINCMMGYPSILKRSSETLSQPFNHRKSCRTQDLENTSQQAIHPYLYSSTPLRQTDPSAMLFDSYKNSYKQMKSRSQTIEPTRISTCL